VVLKGAAMVISNSERKKSTPAFLRLQCTHCARVPRQRTLARIRVAKRVYYGLLRFHDVCERIGQIMQIPENGPTKVWSQFKCYGQRLEKRRVKNPEIDQARAIKQ
jgi:hypothetical protein